jgi:hypothetical protein
MRKSEKGPYGDNRRASPRFEVPLFIKDASGQYTARFGRLGIQGVYFETPDTLQVSDLVDVKIVLVGLGLEVKTTCKVISVLHTSDFSRVAARFHSIPFETERMIARWLDLLNLAHQKSKAA